MPTDLHIRESDGSNQLDGMDMRDADRMKRSFGPLVLQHDAVTKTLIRKQDRRPSAMAHFLSIVL